MQHTVPITALRISAAGLLCSQPREKNFSLGCARYAEPILVYDKDYGSQHQETTPNKKLPLVGSFLFGAALRIRTVDLLFTKQLL